MSSSRRILIAIAGGILLGIFLGERASFLRYVADGYIRLLQMTVLPYVTVSLIAGIGSLRLDQAKALGLKVGLILALVWSFALAMALLVPLAFPARQAASFFSTSLVEPKEPFDFINLYIPSNPFHSLANGIVPAVVLFSVILGVALIGLGEKQRLIEVLAVAGKAVARVARLISRLTPVGLFAIAASTAGTLDLVQVQRLQIYLVAYAATALLLALWVLPGLVSALTPIGYRKIFAAMHDALITAFFIGDLFIVLPILIENSKKLLEDHVAGARDAGSLPEIIIPAAFNFPHAGKLLSISFILFAAWFANSDLGIGEYPKLAFVGLFSFFGSLNVAVPYLLDLFRIPADTFQLFLATGVINAHFGTLVAAVHTVVLGLLGACAVTGTLKFNARRIVRYAVVTGLLTFLIIGGTRIFFTTFAPPKYDKDRVVAAMQLLREPQPATVHRNVPAGRTGFDPAKSQLELIRESQVLRVGYLNDSLPYAYFNAAGDLVGFDVEMAYALARELGVRLEFVPVDRGPEKGREQLAGSYCDLVMSGVVVTTERAREVLFSASYLDETMAFIVPDYRRGDFGDWEKIRTLKGVRIGVPDISAFAETLRSRVPSAEVVTFRESAEVFGDRSQNFDAILLPAERGSVWTLLNPQYCVVVPQPGVIKIPLAYVLARHDQSLANMVNTWIELKKRDGTIAALYDHWILGRNAVPKEPRWSIIRNVLHWMR
jgi:Na+/H+-dicarboxylate symporter/ABC-type amino acid transport substrate-binding protein